MRKDMEDPIKFQAQVRIEHNSGLIDKIEHELRTASLVSQMINRQTGITRLMMDTRILLMEHIIKDSVIMGRKWHTDNSMIALNQYLKELEDYLNYEQSEVPESAV